MDPFLKNNNTRTKLLMRNCEIGPGDPRSLPLALGRHTIKSLNTICLVDCHLGEESLIETMLSLSMRPQLKGLVLYGSDMRSIGCTCLVTLVQWTITKLRCINLCESGIDDDGLKTLI